MHQAEVKETIARDGLALEGAEVVDVLADGKQFLAQAC